MWQVWTSSWCTHHTRAVTRSSSQGSKADYNKSRQLKNSQQQLWAWTCQRFACWGSLVSPRNVVASVLGALQNLLWALGSAEDPQSVRWHKAVMFSYKMQFYMPEEISNGPSLQKTLHTSNFHSRPFNNFQTLFALSLFYSNTKKIQAALLTEKMLLDLLAIKFPTSNVSLRPRQKRLNNPKFYLLKQGSPFHLCKGHCKGKQGYRDSAQSTLKAKQLWPRQLFSGLGGRFFPFHLPYMNKVDFTTQGELPVINISELLH